MKCINIYILLSFFLFAQDRGQSLYSDKKFEQAIKYYESFLDKNSDFDGAKFGIGASAYQLGEKETASSIFNDISSYADSSLKSKAFYNIATLMNEKNKLKESLTYLRKSIEFDPQNEDAKINYELLKRMMEQNNEQSNSEGEDSENDEKGEQNNGESGKEDVSGKNEKGDQNNGESGKEDDSGKNEKGDQNNGESGQKDDNVINGKDNQDDQNNESEQEKNSNKNNNTNYDKTDKQLQSEAILEALKDNEKINQRRKISSKKSLKLSKDW